MKQSEEVRWPRSQGGARTDDGETQDVVAGARLLVVDAAAVLALLRLLQPLDEEDGRVEPRVVVEAGAGPAARGPVQAPVQREQRLAVGALVQEDHLHLRRPAGAGARVARQQQRLARHAGELAQACVQARGRKRMKEKESKKEES